ncbi:MAG: VCBS repeat-containing protein [Candidatus Methylumidiphilus sp.]
MNTRKLVFLNIMAYLLMICSDLASAVTFDSNWDFGNVKIDSSKEFVLTISNKSLSSSFYGELSIAKPFYLKDGSTRTQKMRLSLGLLEKSNINIGFTPTSGGNFQEKVTYKYCGNRGCDLQVDGQSKSAGPFSGTGIVIDSVNLNTQDWTTNSWALDWRPDGHEQVITGDFNGDGIKDVAHSRSRWGAWRVSLSTGSGFNTQDWSTSPYWSIDLRPDGHEEIVTGDFNGDGKTDVAHSRSRWGDWRVSLSTGSGFNTQNWSTTPYWTIDWRPDGHEQIITGDFNGDGKTDIAHSRSRWGAWRVSLSTGSGFNTQDWSTSPYWSIDLRPDGHEEIVTGDFNGDGKTDVAHSRSRWGDWRVSLSTGSGFNTQNWSTSPYWTIDSRPDGHEEIVTGDFNGDGKTDIAHSRSRWGAWRVSLSTGSGFNTQDWSTGSWAIDLRADGHEKIVVADFNGDKKSDIAHTRSQWGYWKVSLSQNNSFVTQEWYTNPFWAVDLLRDNHEEVIVGDFTGDGLADFAHSRSRWSGWRVSVNK